MAKRSVKSNERYAPSIHTQLLEIGKYDTVKEPGYGEIHFHKPPALTCDLTTFTMSWFLHGPGSTVPTPSKGIFVLWERYRQAHLRCCEDYRRALFTLFLRSPQAKYTEQQWRLLGRTKPTETDLRKVVNHAELSLYQHQRKAGQPFEYEVQVSFVIFWDEHGLASKLSMNENNFVVPAWSDWSSIGNL